jgi:hypothetical protein
VANTTTLLEQQSGAFDRGAQKEFRMGEQFRLQESLRVNALMDVWILLITVVILGGKQSTPKNINSSKLEEEILFPTTTAKSFHL